VATRQPTRKHKKKLKPARPRQSDSLSYHFHKRWEIKAVALASHIILNINREILHQSILAIGTFDVLVWYKDIAGWQ